MKITSFRVLIAAGLLWGGGQGLYTALFNLKPIEYSISDYLAAQPDKEWLTITGGSLDIVEMAYTSSKVGDRVKEVFIPLTLPNAKESDPVKILVASKDPAVLDLATKLKSAKNEIEAMMLFITAKTTMEKPAVTGLVRFGIDLKDKETRKLRELNKNLASDFVILEEGGKPNFVVSAVLFLAGLVLLGLMFKGLASKTTPPPLPAPKPEL